MSFCSYDFVESEKYPLWISALPIRLWIHHHGFALKRGVGFNIAGYSVVYLGETRSRRTVCHRYFSPALRLEELLWAVRCISRRAHPALSEAGLSLIPDASFDAL
jgi:hypothetical protein